MIGVSAGHRHGSRIRGGVRCNPARQPKINSWVQEGQDCLSKPGRAISVQPEDTEAQIDFGFELPGHPVQAS